MPATKYPDVENFIAGRFQPSPGERLEVVCPLDGSRLSSVPLSTPQDLDRAAAAAQEAFPEWSAGTVRERAQVFYEYRRLLHDRREDLAALVQEENGKTLAEARAEIQKAVEASEFACSLPQLVAGEVLEVSRGVECRVDRVPLGVVASVCPFNFPAMVPHWTIPSALVLGNTFLLKPSEQVPLTAGRVAALLQEAGLPDGVFNVVHGGRAVVEGICDHPAVQAVTFVGSTEVAARVYARAAGNLKRCLAMGGAKNHLIALPDADVEPSALDIAGAATGCAGQRCMASSLLIVVGDGEPLVAKVCEAARNIVPGRDMGAVISRAARERIERAVTEAERAGAEVLVDGRSCVVPGREDGFYVGPTVLDRATPEMRIAQDEVFGPVLAIVRVKDVAEALAIENRSPYGNAATVYTRDRRLAAAVASRASAGMIGVNVGVPVPREPFGFGGWNDSRYGAGDITGKSAIEFWTQSRKTTSRWTWTADAEPGR